MRKKIVAGNHKMNLNKRDLVNLIDEIKDFSFDGGNKELIIFPSTLLLDAATSATSISLKIGAQNAHYESNGAFTGEVSFEQAKELGLSHVLIGHSERRELFNENNQIIKSKIDKALKVDLTPIFCCGEPLDVRESNTQKEYVINQLKESVFHLDAQAFSKLILAYEPIWAIGTGKTANSAQAEEMHRDIRDAIAAKYNQEVADMCTILYGGSCKPSNAEELFNCENVDGGLIGGASLKAEDFKAIAQAL